MPHRRGPSSRRFPWPAAAGCQVAFAVARPGCEPAVAPRYHGVFAPGRRRLHPVGPIGRRLLDPSEVDAMATHAHGSATARSPLARRADYGAIVARGDTATGRSTAS